MDNVDRMCKIIEESLDTLNEQVTLANEVIDEIIDEENGYLTYKYEWYHIPTGKTGSNKLRVHSRLEFLEALSKWNRTQITQEWVYTEEMEYDFDKIRRERHEDYCDTGE